MAFKVQMLKVAMLKAFLHLSKFGLLAVADFLNSQAWTLNLEKYYLWINMRKVFYICHVMAEDLFKINSLKKIPFGFILIAFITAELF